MTQYGFFFDNSRCTGCRTCTMACKDYKDLPTEIAFRTVYDYEGGTWVEAADGAYTCDSFAYHVSVACNHCASPACVEACPTGAMTKDGETGLVDRDIEVCIGCGSCAKACPYGAPKVDTEQQKSMKCNGCVERVTEGLDPICAAACPLRALEFGNIDELRTAHPTAVDAIAPLVDGTITGPSLAIQPCPAAKNPDDTTGMTANPLEITG